MSAARSGAVSERNATGIDACIAIDRDGRGERDRAAFAIERGAVEASPPRVTCGGARSVL